MQRRGKIAAGSGDPRGRRRSYGWAAGVCVALILLAAGAWAAHRSFENYVGPLLPDGVTPADASRTGERFIVGLMEGEIGPEAGVRVISGLLTAADDGILTREEIGSILEQMRRARGMNL